MKQQEFGKKKCDIRLESGRIAASSRIELVNGSKESICILSSPPIVLVDVGQDVTLGRTPKALQEAENLRCLGVAIGTRFAEEGG